MGNWKKTQCNFCGLSCGLEMYVEDNKIVSVRPDKESPRTPDVYCCRKGRSSKYFQENTERLNYPLKRVGDHFERISWEQAIQEIAEKARAILDVHGPRCFAYCGGALASGQADGVFAKQMLGAIGSQYCYHPLGLEFAGNWWSHGKILGDQARYTEPDEKHAEVIIMWGSNAYVAHNVHEGRKVIREFSENPDKMLIVVDPRLSETARMADMHVMIRPGADSLLLRGLIAMILDKGWQDQEFLDKWTTGWDRVKLWFEGFDYKEAFRVSKVPYGQMEKLAKILTTKSWGVHQDLGLFCGRHNTLNSYLILMLMAVTGNLLMKGNISLDSFVSRGKTVNEHDPNVWRTVETNRFPVLGSYPTGVMGKEMLSEKEDRLRIMFLSMSNPARSYPDTKSQIAGFKNLELMVVIDMYMTETAKLADYVLPGKTGFEAYEFNMFPATGPEIPCTLKHPIIGQIGERKENTRIWFEILDAMGYIPELPKTLYVMAEKAVAEKDRIPYFLAVQQYIKAHPEHASKMVLIVCKTMGQAMGSINRALLWVALLASPMKDNGAAERAGFGPGDKHPEWLDNPVLSKLLMMDQVFQAVDDIPQGVIAGYTNTEKDVYMREHILHEDKKLHLWCEEIENYIQRITPQAEEQALEGDGQFPLILSAGRHADGGDNTSMRNPATYVYRKPYSVTMNPADAERFGVAEDETVRVVTKGGSICAPVEISYQASPGYALIPHQYGLQFGKNTYGEGINELTSADDLDELTGNPWFRYVPCRIEKL